MSTLTFGQIHQKLVDRFGDAIGPLQAPKRDPFCTFAVPRVLDICKLLKEDAALRFDFLEDLTATDHPKENLIRVVYHFYSYRHRHMFIAKAEVNRLQPELDSVESIWKSANWMEREVFDLYGIIFKGHPDLRRILMPDDWVGHPLRKDYTEAGGYQGISNVRDNPLDLYLTLDRERRASEATAAAAPQGDAAPPAESTAQSDSPAKTDAAAGS